MKTRNPSAFFALCVALLLAAFLIMLPPAVAGSDDQVIIAATRKYLAAESYPTGMKIKVEKVQGDYARVAVDPEEEGHGRGHRFPKTRARHLERSHHRHRLGPSRPGQAPYPQVSSSLILEAPKSPALRSDRLLRPGCAQLGRDRGIF